MYSHSNCTYLSTYLHCKEAIHPSVYYICQTICVLQSGVRIHGSFTGAKGMFHVLPCSDVCVGVMENVFVFHVWFMCLELLATWCMISLTIFCSQDFSCHLFVFLFFQQFLSLNFSSSFLQPGSRSFYSLPVWVKMKESVDSCLDLSCLALAWNRVPGSN